MLHKSKKLQEAVQKHGYENATFGMELSGAFDFEDVLKLLNSANEAGKRGLNLYWCEHQEWIVFFAAPTSEDAIKLASAKVR